VNGFDHWFGPGGFPQRDAETRPGQPVQKLGKSHQLWKSFRSDFHDPIYRLPVSFACRTKISNSLG
jgi:hypothetical protein